jgi:hypothetical protein
MFGYTALPDMQFPAERVATAREAMQVTGHGQTAAATQTYKILRRSGMLVMKPWNLQLFVVCLLFVCCRIEIS